MALAERQPSQVRLSFLRRRWRLLLAAGVAIVVAMLARGGTLPPGLSTLIGWDAGCVTFLAATFWMMLKDDEATVRARAAYEDEGQTVTLIGTGLGAIGGPAMDRALAALDVFGGFLRAQAITPEHTRAIRQSVDAFTPGGRGA